MKLRNFLYLNTKLLDDYLSCIEGCTYDNEDYSITQSTENELKAGVGINVLSGNGSHKGISEETRKRSVQINDPAKFDKVYRYLKAGNEEEKLNYYEILTEEDYVALKRDDFLEVLVTPRFSKLKELTDACEKIFGLATMAEKITDQNILDKKTQEALNGFSLLKQIQSGKDITCVFDFEDRKYPLLAHLDENYFKCSQNNFAGEVYVVCKITKKIQKGEIVKLDEIFGDVNKFPMNRQQRRRMEKSMSNPNELKDTVKGPALEVLPIAVYQ